MYSPARSKEHLKEFTMKDTYTRIFKVIIDILKKQALWHKYMSQVDGKHYNDWALYLALNLEVNEAKSETLCNLCHLIKGSIPVG